MTHRALTAALKGLSAFCFKVYSDGGCVKFKGTVGSNIDYLSGIRFSRKLIPKSFIIIQMVLC